jgi:hypothetical protein
MRGRCSASALSVNSPGGICYPRASGRLPNRPAPIGSFMSGSLLQLVSHPPDFEPGLLDDLPVCLFLLR